MSSYDHKQEPHLAAIPWSSRITMRHVKSLDPEDKRLCTATEDVAILARQPNSWMTDKHVQACKDFAGTESEAVELRNSIELACSDSLAGWQMYN